MRLRRLFDPFRAYGRCCAGGFKLACCQHQQDRDVEVIPDHWASAADQEHETGLKNSSSLQDLSNPLTVIGIIAEHVDVDL
jgi:hypothetical protein